MQIRPGREMTNLKAITQLVRQKTWQIIGKGPKFSCVKQQKDGATWLVWKLLFGLLFSKVVHQSSESNIFDNHEVNNHWPLQMIEWLVEKLNDVRKPHWRIWYQYKRDECAFITFKQNVSEIHEFIPLFLVLQFSRKFLKGS